MKMRLHVSIFIGWLFIFPSFSRKFSTSQHKHTLFSSVLFSFFLSFFLFFSLLLFILALGCCCCCRCCFCCFLIFLFLFTLSICSSCETRSRIARCESMYVCVCYVAMTPIKTSCAYGNASLRCLILYCRTLRHVRAYAFEFL